MSNLEANLNAAETEKEEPVYYMMNMPDWFIEMDEKSKVDLAKKIARSPSQPLTQEDFANLINQV